MANITFEDYRPPERTDGVAWSQVRVYEGPASTGPWTLIDTITSLAWSPSGVDSNPRYPASRSFTTDDATLPDGWYRVIWLDNGGGQSDPSEAVQNGASAQAGIRPTVHELGAFMRARTRAGTAGLQGTFNDDTRPTADQADLMIDLAANAILGQLGDIPDRLRVRVRSVVILLAAMYVEQSYYPDQVANEDQSPWQQYKDLYDDQIAALERAVAGNEPGSRFPRMGSIPAYGLNGRAAHDPHSFPLDHRPAGGYWSRRHWW